MKTEGQSIDRTGSPPAVSIIMPSYNVSRYIGEAIDSVLGQTFTDFEIIVVNDGSTDTEELERVLEPYRQRITYIKQENRGCSGARNVGIAAARGRLIALLDPDDVWEPEYLAVQVDMMKRDPTIDVLYSNATIFGDVPENGKFFMDLSPSEGDVTLERLIKQRCTVMVSVLARRKTIVQAGMFDESLRSTEDFDLWLRIVYKGGRICYHRRPLVRYRRRPDSLSSDAVWMSKHALRVLEKAEREMILSLAERQALEEELMRLRAMLGMYEGKIAFLRGNIEESIKGFREANKFFRSKKLGLILLLLRASPHFLLRVYNLRNRVMMTIRNNDAHQRVCSRPAEPDNNRRRPRAAQSGIAQGGAGRGARP